MGFDGHHPSYINALKVSLCYTKIFSPSASTRAQRLLQYWTFYDMGGGRYIHVPVLKARLWRFI